ncbi:uncharacterized protein HMPREF1541_01963 [Cyphellophora europaea CBS 101466]|uniref:FAD-binding domain-containing protein n=1 Tax=Cyphellophora europaea (strain CBS 101466) TaxID=1220924 RepID=W2S2I2_CYPE1|nr:uncharacterized protein HMPREF1541_01963 [Cyphellophora europaea CBS 101466]ETN42805.1 hypothetical protein HMPREF1541_01963 [Cyphellophora europaea CBS 101466]
MKIIIIGAGIGGLSTYLALRKHLPSNERHEISIYEAHDVEHYLDLHGGNKGTTEASELPGATDDEPTFTPEAIAGAIGIARNGLEVLLRLDEDQHSESSIITQMLTKGHPASKWKLGSARGWQLAEARMASPASTEGGITSIMISRQEMWKILLRAVVQVGGEGAIRRAQVKKVVLPKHGQAARPKVVFEDEFPEEKADFVVGADGLRSVVRAAMFPKPDPAEEVQTPWSWSRWLLSWFHSTPMPTDYISPRYEGLVGVAGFVPSSVLTSAGQERGSMSITFGPNGFFGCGFFSTAPSSLASPLTLSTAESAPEPGSTAGWWSTFAADDPWPYHTRNDHGSRPKPQQDFDRDTALKDLLARHKHWKDPSVQAILRYAKDNTEKCLQGVWPTWTTPPLPTWTKGNVVLMGDAAHALQPSSGQGACQALEDAETLARFLGHFCARKEGGGNDEYIRRALTKYEQLRMPRVAEIYMRSQRMGKMKKDMGFVSEMLTYAVIKVMGMMHSSANERLVAYDLPAEVDQALNGR